MRVIAGTYRSRVLSAPRGQETRPTSDRLRETLFNVLGPSVPGARFADLYAGTGAVGIEAISRGAAHVFFAEIAQPALRIIRHNLQQLGIEAGYTIGDRGVAELLARLVGGALSHPLDLVFLDPPYEAAGEYAATLEFLGSAPGRRVLAAGSRVIAEHGRKTQLPARVGELVRTRTLPQGDAVLTFYALAETRPTA